MLKHPYRTPGLVGSLAVILILGTGLVDNLTGRHLSWSGKLPFPSADLQQHHYAAGVAAAGPLLDLYQKEDGTMKAASYVYPPLLPQIMSHVAPWSYPTWCWGWLVISIACLATAGFQLHSIFSPPAPRLLTLIALFGLPVSFYSLIIGQNSALSLVLFTTSALLLDRNRPIWAGAVVALLFYKPQWIALAGLFMLASGHWRWCLGLGAASALLWVVGLLTCGWEAHRAWLETVFNMSAGTRAQPAHLNQSLTGALQFLLREAPPAIRGLSLLGTGLGLTALAGLAARRFQITPARSLFLGLGVLLLTSPYLLHYDLLLGGGLWLWSLSRPGLWSRLAALAFWLACLVSINPTYMPLSPAIPLLLAWMVLVGIQRVSMEIPNPPLARRASSAIHKT